MPTHPNTWPFVPTQSVVEIDHGEGVWLVTRQGQRILDAAGGAIVSNIGHGRPEIGAVAAQALARGGYMVPTFLTPERERLVARLMGWLPAPLTRVFFTSGGSEAGDAAIRLARQHHLLKGAPERWKVIGREPSYHGATALTLAVGGHHSRRAGYDVLSANFPKVPAPYSLRSPLGRHHPDEDLRCAAALEDTIEREGPETIAAVIGEPIIGTSGGALVPGPRYWPEVQRICRKYGILLIIDEVMTGLGRTGTKFAVEHFGVRPDILYTSKGLTGGYGPLGAVFASDETLAPLAAKGESLMFYTYGGHSAVCAIADKVLQILEDEALVARAARQGAKLQALLTERLGEHPHVAEIRGEGLLRAVELVADRATLERFPKTAGITQAVVARGLEHGAFFYPGGTGEVRDVIGLGPAFTVTDAELEIMVERLALAIDSALKGAT